LPSSGNARDRCIAPTRLAARCAIRFSLRSNLPSDAIAGVEVGAWLGLPLITFGIYGLVWFYKVHSELHAYDRRIGDSAVNALLSMIFGVITLGTWPLVMWAKLGGRIAAAQCAAGLQPTCSGGIGFLLGVIGFGVLSSQIQLTKVVDRYGATPPGQQVSLVA